MATVQCRGISEFMIVVNWTTSMYKVSVLRYGARTLASLFNATSVFSWRAFAASIRPPETVYSGEKTIRPVTKQTIVKKFKQGEPLTMVTAYDYPSAVHVRLKSQSKGSKVV